MEQPSFNYYCPKCEKTFKSFERQIISCPVCNAKDKKIGRVEKHVTAFECPNDHFFLVPHVMPILERNIFSIPPATIPTWQVYLLQRQYQNITGGFFSLAWFRPQGYIEIQTDYEGMPVSNFKLRIAKQFHDYFDQLLHESSVAFRGMTTLYPDILIDFKVRYEPPKEDTDTYILGQPPRP